MKSRFAEEGRLLRLERLIEGEEQHLNQLKERRRDRSCRVGPQVAHQEVIEEIALAARRLADFCDKWKDLAVDLYFEDR